MTFCPVIAKILISMTKYVELHTAVIVIKYLNEVVFTQINCIAWSLDKDFELPILEVLELDLDRRRAI